MVVDAEANKEPGRPLFGVNGEVRSKKFDRADIVRDVGFGVNQDLTIDFVADNPPSDCRFWRL